VRAGQGIGADLGKVRRLPDIERYCDDIGVVAFGEPANGGRRSRPA
jgi:hypothetical protein